MKNKTLEEILQEYFGCEKPFLDEPYYDEGERAPVTFTDEGSAAYSRLTRLLYDISILTNVDVNRIVDTLDSISSEL